MNICKACGCDCKNVICHKCAKTHSRCKKCGYYHEKRLMSKGICFGCYDKRRFSTRVRSGYSGWSRKYLRSDRMFGVEIETANGSYDRVPDGWGISEDGSIEGLEFQSPLLRGDGGLREIQKFYKLVKPVFSPKCGLHVHFDFMNEYRAIKANYPKCWSEDYYDDEYHETAKYLQNELIRHLTPVLNCYKPWMRSYVHPRRLGNDYCTMNEEYLEKYCWVNYHPTYKTLEFRLLEGCDYMKLKKWIQVCMEIVDSISRCIEYSYEGDECLVG